MSLALYMDQDSLSLAVISALRSAGIDVVTATEAGRERTDDAEQLAFAAADGRMLYTANRRDFARLHAEWMSEGRQHCGIVVRSRQRMSIGGQIRGLTRLCTTMGSEAAANRFEYLENWILERPS